MSNVPSAICFMKRSANKRGRRGTYGREKDQSSVFRCFTACCGKREFLLSCLDSALETSVSFHTSCIREYRRLRSSYHFPFSPAFPAAHDCSPVDKTVGNRKPAVVRKPVYHFFFPVSAVPSPVLFRDRKYWHMGSLPLLSARD